MERGAVARRVDRAAGELRLLRRFRPNASAAIRQKELQLELATSSLEATSWDVEEVRPSFNVLRPFRSYAELC